MFRRVTGHNKGVKSAELRSTFRLRRSYTTTQSLQKKKINKTKSTKAFTNKIFFTRLDQKVTAETLLEHTLTLWKTRFTWTPANHEGKDLQHRCWCHFIMLTRAHKTNAKHQLHPIKPIDWCRCIGSSSNEWSGFVWRLPLFIERTLHGCSEILLPKLTWNGTACAAAVINALVH